MGRVIDLKANEARLKRRIREHLKSLGFARDAEGRLLTPKVDKEAYRQVHAAQREDRWRKNKVFFSDAWPRLGSYFADGADVDPSNIQAELELISASTWQSDLFRLASMLWSIPVSQGFGRRLRFLVWDRRNDKLIGLFALGDPVFNLRARDEEIGWSGARRADALVNVLDAYVVGAVPPYNKLLAGKLVASLIPSREIVSVFSRRYRDTSGIISGKKKGAQLVAVTTTSALGRSSLYNRLKLEGRMIFEPIGFTTGYGHFHIPDRLFNDMRVMLELRGERYASNHGYGEGPNWKLRTVRRALEILGMDPHLTRHGMPREVYFCPIAANAKQVLRGERKRADFSQLRTANEMAELAMTRWVRPRASRDDTYKLIGRDEIFCQIGWSLTSQAQARLASDAHGY
jgi:hypothetical protein